MTMDTTPKTQDKVLTPEDQTLKGSKPSPESTEPSPKETPQTYTKEEMDRILQLDRMKAGRDWKALETERDNLKKELAKKDSKIQEVDDEIAKLKTQIDDLASDDPDKKNFIAKLREAEAEKKAAKAERTALEADKQAHQEQVTLATNTLREISIWEISAEYETGEPIEERAVKLKRLCDKGKVTSEEDIREYADTLWTKKPVTPAQPATPPIKPDSGITLGGGKSDEDIRKNYRENPNDPQSRKDYLEYVERKKGYKIH